MTSPAPQIDLLAWPAVHDAQVRVEAAHAARSEAERRYRVAPHGELQNRRKAFQEATQEALRAEAALAQLVREAMH